MGYELAVVTALAEELVRMGLLEVARPDFRARDLRRDREHGRIAPVRVEEAVDEVEVAGTAAPGARRQSPGQLRLRASGEGARLLVAHVHPGEFPASANCVRERIQAVTDDAIDAFDPCCG